MFEIKTNLKCLGGCGISLPKKQYDEKVGRSNWFGAYRFDELIEWICIDCWDNGVRYKDCE